jgi:glycosyltransferase involved in cell wall biosynthesis
LIAYGAPILDPESDRLPELDVATAGYHLVVARMEPENHIHLIVDGFSRAASDNPLVVVGSTPYGDEYVQRVRASAGTADVRFVGSIWDQDLLNQLYAHCLSYLHGHSVGGTNPSLLRALGCGAPVTAFDVNFNREVTAGNARFFTDSSDVTRAVGADDDDPSGASLRGKLGKEHAEATYNWDDVTDKYEAMLREISRW